MGNITTMRVLLVAAIAATVVHSGCATRVAPDIAGGWKPVNRYAETTEAIPLHRSYVFQPTPMDGTLKNMLARWSRDSQMSLSYLHPSDFTLHSPVEQVHTYSIDEAASLLNSIYAEQRVSVSVAGKQIIVRETVAPFPGTQDAAADAGSLP